ncbi:MAG: 3-oxoacyl-ACP reductase FabG [Clostridia bacterium]|nr:3-oxoacyl-ACP reductase FabG [Clostridia bacterium]
MSKTAVITGASKGIGAATAILFARKGYNVVLNYNQSFQSVKLLSSSLTGQGYNVLAVKADVSNKLETDFLISETVSKFGSVDVLINNAGISVSGAINVMDTYDSDRIFDVNLKGVYNCCKSAVNKMVAQKSGRIINISSMWGQVGASCEVAYSASKAGVIGLTKALAKELAPSGITVNAIAPGIIDTSMNAGLTVEEIEEFVSRVPLGRIGTPDDVAAAALFLASDDADYITGQIIGVSGGYVI